MAQRCRAPFADIVIHETRALCECQPPRNDAEYDAFLAKSQALTSKISAITHADLMARSHPRVAEEIFDAARQFCDHAPLTGDVYNESMKLTTEVSTICHRDSMQRYRT